MTVQRMSMSVTVHRIACSKNAGTETCTAAGCYQYKSMPKDRAEVHFLVAKKTTACGQTGKTTYTDSKVNCIDCETYLYADPEDDDVEVEDVYAA